MAGSASISGLASGLDTATIVSQLMQLEAIPQSRLKTQVTSHESAITKLQELNTKIAALFTKAEALSKPAGWAPVAATSSYDKVSVTTTRSEEHTSELQSRQYLVCRLPLEKKYKVLSLLTHTPRTSYS